MGSGGPRGLQILRSGASSVRGGFDSHAFPPSFRGVAGAWLAATLIAGPILVSEAGAAPPPTATRADSVAGPPAPSVPGDPVRTSAASGADTMTVETPDTSTTSGIRLLGSGRAARDTSARVQSRFDTPRWVMLRSLVVPGWGQWTNGSWLKALAVAGVEVGLGLAIHNDVRELDRLLGQVDAARAAKDPEAELNAVAAYNDRQTSLVAREWLLGGAVAYALMDAYVDAHFRRFKVEFRRDRPLPEGATLPAVNRLSVGWAF
jgi:hypothetical protein